MSEALDFLNLLFRDTEQNFLIWTLPDGVSYWFTEPDDAARRIDTLIADIGTALEADRTLGGLCDWIEPEAPASIDLPIEGAAALKASVITVVLHYTTTGPLA